MILSRLSCTHNYCVAPRKLNINRMQSADHFRNSRIVRFEVDLVRQRRSQHTKTRLGNLTPLCRSAPVAHWPKEHDGGSRDDEHDNPTSHKKKFAAAFHAPQCEVAQRQGERWRRTGSARICKPPPPAAIRSTEK